MVDVVMNHMGYLGCRSCVNYSVYSPFNAVRSITAETYGVWLVLVAADL